MGPQPLFFAAAVGDRLNDTFPHWIKRRGHVEWPPCSPDLSPFGFFFYGMLTPWRPAAFGDFRKKNA